MADWQSTSFGSTTGEMGGGVQGLGDFNYGFMGGGTTPGPAVASSDTVSLGPTTRSASEYLRQKYAKQFAEPVRVAQPRPRTTPTVPAPGEAPNSVGAYYRRKYAAFYDPATSWASVGVPPSAAPLSEKITGTTHITIEDLLMLIQVISAELVTLSNLRSANPDTIRKVHDMDVLLGDLRTLSTKLDQGLLREYQIPIRASVATTFLKTFRYSPTLPPLIDAVAPPPPVDIPTLGTVGGEASPVKPAKRGPDIVLLFQDVQQTRWELEASLDPRLAHYEDMLGRLSQMEQRIVSYATSDTPMPADLQIEFEDEIRRLRAQFDKLRGSE